jgi:putative drug exporter of the RND superfamily
VRLRNKCSVTLCGVLERWTGVVLRRRALVLGCWLGILVAGSVAASGLPARLSTSYAVPGTDSDEARQLLARHFGEQPEGTFVVVFDVPRSSTAVERVLHRRLKAAAAAVPTGHAGPLRKGDKILYGSISTTLSLAEAKAYTERVRTALRDGAPRVYVTGEPAIQHDVDPVVHGDVRRAEVVALTIAAVVLVVMFGLTPAVLIPFLFAACAIAGALGIVRVLAELLPMTTYVTAFVNLIGLGLAIDYSLLVVARFREEHVHGVTAHDAAVRTIASAGRTIVFSALAVAIGLAVLLLVPVPFIRSLGLAGALVPLVSIAAVLTLQPVLLSALGGGVRMPKPTRGSGLWTKLATAVLRRPGVVLVLAVGLLLLLSIPALSLRLTPASLSGISATPESIVGFDRLSDGVGPGAVTPIEVVVDAGRRGANDAPTRAAVDRLADVLFHDPEVLLVASGSHKPYVDATGRYARVIVVGRHEVGAGPSQRLVKRLRGELVPAARFPDAVAVTAGGGPPQGVDFLDRTYGNLPWIVLLVLVTSFVVLLRAFRSLVLPLQAVLLNLLTVAAVCGLLVLVFQWGLGRYVGLPHTDAIEGWVPVLLFATLFGLSMDYEVFLVSRMREAWDEHPDTSEAVKTGLERSGRVVTAAAIIMIAAFAGFAVGRVLGLQQLGLGLALGVLIDAALVRMIVLPAAIGVLGPYNWWLPARVARIVRVNSSPLRT